MTGRTRPLADVAVLGVCLFASACSGGGSPGSGTGGTGGGNSDPAVTLGDMQTLLPDGNALGLSYFPDEGTSILSTDPFRIMLTDGAKKASVVVTASTTSAPLMNLAQATTVVSPGATADFDNGYAGISAVYRHTDGIYYGFYHAEDQVGTGTIPGTSIPGFYARIGIATSPDGTTWTKGGYVIESFVPKRTPNGTTVQYDQGTAEPGAVASADGKWLYLYYTEHSRVDPAGGARPVLICMARADLGAWPPVLSTTAGPVTGFKKYYQGDFSTDGIDGEDSPVVSPPTGASNALEGHVAYSSALSKYVMVYGVDAWGERAASPPVAAVSGLYLAFSPTTRSPGALRARRSSRLRRGPAGAERLVGGLAPLGHRRRHAGLAGLRLQPGLVDAAPLPGRAAAGAQRALSAPALVQGISLTEAQTPCVQEAAWQFDTGAPQVVAGAAGQAPAKTWIRSKSADPALKFSSLTTMSLVPASAVNGLANQAQLPSGTTGVTTSFGYPVL